MPMPTAYTEESLAAFMVQTLGAVAGDLGLTAESFGEAVNDTLNTYGVDDITDVDNIPELRALARVYAWRLAADNAAAEVSTTGDGRSLSLSDLSDKIEKRLDAAETEAVGYGHWLRASTPWITRTVVRDGDRDRDEYSTCR